MAEVAEVGSEFVESSTGLLELAEDVTSTISDSGLEFLNELGGLESGLDLVGGIDAFDYDLVGSFAGDSEWFTANNFGEIFGGPEPLGNLGGAGFPSPFDQVSDFFGDLKDSVIGPEQLGGPGAGGSFFGSLVDRASSVLPSTDQLAAQIQKSITQQIVTTGIKTAAGAVSGAAAGIPVVGGIVAGAVNRTAGAVNASINQQIGGRPAANISLSQLTGITPNIGIPDVPGIQLASLGPIPLTNIKLPTGAVSVTGPNGQPLNIQTPGINPSATQSTVFANYTSSYDPETGQYAVIGQDGQPLSGYTNLTEDLAAQIANEANANARDAGSLQPTLQQAGPTVTQAVNAETGDYYTPAANTAPNVSQIDRSAGNVGYTTAFDPETGSYAVVSNETGLPVASGLTEEQAQQQAQQQTQIDSGQQEPGVGDTRVQNRSPNAVTNDINAVIASSTAGNVSGSTFTGALFDTQASDSAVAAALREQARQQQTIRNQRQNKAQAGDWRVRLRLAPRSTYLYNDPDCGPVLWPLQNTDGVIFPYTPSIDFAYKANYNAYDLTHSNYKGYFYQNSAVDQINVRAQFTAQDTTEANYLLAVIHFFRSATKMFYGQDSQRGSPPPLCYLSGYGDYQFSEHPVVISQFNYNLPADVNYIRAQTTTDVGTNLQPQARQRQTVASNPLSYAYQRLKSLGQGINKGALDFNFAAQGSLGVGNPTYVPTKIEITLSLLPVQSRQQVSQQFSLKGFANGNLLKGGFW